MFLVRKARKKIYKIRKKPKGNEENVETKSYTHTGSTDGTDNKTDGPSAAETQRNEEFPDIDLSLQVPQAGDDSHSDLEPDNDNVQNENHNQLLHTPESIKNKDLTKRKQDGLKENWDKYSATGSIPPPGFQDGENGEEPLWEITPEDMVPRNGTKTPEEIREAELRNNRALSVTPEKLSYHSNGDSGVISDDQQTDVKENNSVSSVSEIHTGNYSRELSQSAGNIDKSPVKASEPNPTEDKSGRPRMQKAATLDDRGRLKRPPPFQKQQTVDESKLRSQATKPGDRPVDTTRSTDTTRYPNYENMTGETPVPALRKSKTVDYTAVQRRSQPPRITKQTTVDEAVLRKRQSSPITVIGVRDSSQTKPLTLITDDNETEVKRDYRHNWNALSGDEQSGHDNQPVRPPLEKLPSYEEHMQKRQQPQAVRSLSVDNDVPSTSSAHPEARVKVADDSDALTETLLTPPIAVQGKQSIERLNNTFYGDTSGGETEQVDNKPSILNNQPPGEGLKEKLRALKDDTAIVEIDGTDGFVIPEPVEISNVLLEYGLQSGIDFQQSDTPDGLDSEQIKDDGLDDYLISASPSLTRHDHFFERIEEQSRPVSRRGNRVEVDGDSLELEDELTTENGDVIIRSAPVAKHHQQDPEPPFEFDSTSADDSSLNIDIPSHTNAEVHTEDCVLHDAAEDRRSGPSVQRSCSCMYHRSDRGAGSLRGAQADSRRHMFAANKPSTLSGN